MPTAVDFGYLSKYRKTLPQWKLLTGQEPPSEWVAEAIVQPELRERYLASERSREYSLREKAQKTQEEQFAQSLAQRESEFTRNLGVEDRRFALTQEELAAQRRANMVSGVAQLGTLATQGAQLYGYGKGAGWWGTGAGAGTTAATATETSTYAGSGVGMAAYAPHSGAPYTIGSGLEAGGTAGGGSIGLGTVAGSAGAGYLGYKYGPFKKESGEAATFGQGGQKEKDVFGGALRGAGAGAVAGAALTSWSGPGAIVGTIVGAIVGGVAGYFGW